LGASWDVIENFPQAKNDELAGSYFYLAYSSMVYEKNNDQALLYCEKALDKNKTEEIKLLQLKLMYLKNDPRYQQTAEEYLQGDFVPARESALTDLARYYAQTRQWDKALLAWVLIEKNTAGKAQNYALFEQGKIYSAMGNPKQAKEIFEKLMREAKQRGIDSKDGLFMNLDAELVKLK
jgi:tetratricopeptide (TPR) repeat protein